MKNWVEFLANEAVESTNDELEDSNIDVQHSDVVLDLVEEVLSQLLCFLLIGNVDIVCTHIYYLYYLIINFHNYIYLTNSI